MLLPVPGRIFIWNRPKLNVSESFKCGPYRPEGSKVNLFGKLRPRSETKQDLTRLVSSPSVPPILTPFSHSKLLESTSSIYLCSAGRLARHHAHSTIPTPSTCPSSPVEYQGHNLSWFTCSRSTGDSDSRPTTSSTFILIPEITLVTYPSRRCHITKTCTSSMSRRASRGLKKRWSWDTDADGVGCKISTPRSGSCDWIS